MRPICIPSLLVLCAGAVQAVPKLLICSDSTTANYAAPNVLQGWGFFIHEYLSIPVINMAKNGRSTRSFISEGLWQTLLSRTSPGDFIIIEMGHNDAGDPTKGDKYIDRGTLPGTGSNSVLVNTSRGMEKVYTFGHYLRVMIKDVQDKQAVPIISGMVPRNVWEGDRMLDATKFAFAEYSKEVAKAANVTYFDHTKHSVQRFTAFGPVKTKTFFPNDSTHTNAEGAQVNAQSLVDAIKCDDRSPLERYLSTKGREVKSPCELRQKWSAAPFVIIQPNLSQE